MDQSQSEVNQNKCNSRLAWRLNWKNYSIGDLTRISRVTVNNASLTDLIFINNSHRAANKGMIHLPLHHPNRCCKGRELSNTAHINTLIKPLQLSTLTFQVLKYRKLNLIYFSKRTWNACLNCIIFSVIYIVFFMFE